MKYREAVREDKAEKADKEKNTTKLNKQSSDVTLLTVINCNCISQETVRVSFVTDTERQKPWR